jgi:acetoin utilization protein AcuB
MTTLQLIDHSIPQLHFQDSAAYALQLMSDFKTTHLPVVNDEIFVGLLSEDVLHGENDCDTTIEAFQNNFIPAAVNENQHFLKAVAVGNLYQANIIPVVNDQRHLQGSVRAQSLMNVMGNMCGAGEYGALIVLEMERSRFSISEINSIVESDDAVIQHLNVAPLAATQLYEVTLQINKKEISTILASFERYEYSVAFYSGEELFETDISANYRNLMNYLDI